MKDKKSSKRLTMLLLISSGLIWGIIGVKIYGTLETAASPPVAEQMTGAVFTERLQTVSAREFDDRLSVLGNPFRPFVPRKLQKRIATPVKPEKKTFTPPPIRYTGYLKSADGLLAIVSLNNSAPRFCSIGDTVFSARILEIKPRVVIAESQGNQFELRLQP